MAKRIMMDRQMNFMYGDLTDGVSTINDVVSIPRGEYEDLLQDSKFLSALEQAGVDVWDGYDLAKEIFNAFNEGTRD